MDRKAVAFGVVGVLLGAGAAWAAGHFTQGPKETGKDAGTAVESTGEDGDEMAANAFLVESLQECNRRLTSLGQKTVEATPAPKEEGRDAGRRGGRGGGGGGGGDRNGPTDWDKQAANGTVPYSIPCLRDTPAKLNDRQIDRLGLAPNDARAVDDATAKSNQRMATQIAPICARVVGKDTADRIGPSACMTAIIDSSRRQDPQKMKDALGRVAEVNGGKRTAPAADTADPVEALMLAVSAESKQFESDLAAQLGPDDARRIATSRSVCSDRGVVRSTQDAPAR